MATTPRHKRLTGEQRRARASLAARTRHHPDDPALANDRHSIALDRLSDHIQKVVDSAPAFTPEQIERLRQLLPPAPVGDHEVRTDPAEDTDHADTATERRSGRGGGQAA